jgi:hypothetical protein
MANWLVLRECGFVELQSGYLSIAPFRCRVAGVFWTWLPRANVPVSALVNVQRACHRRRTIRLLDQKQNRADFASRAWHRR